MKTLLLLALSLIVTTAVVSSSVAETEASPATRRRKLRRKILRKPLSKLAELLGNVGDGQKEELPKNLNADRVNVAGAAADEIIIERSGIEDTESTVNDGANRHGRRFWDRRYLSQFDGGDQVENSQNDVYRVGQNTLHALSRDYPLNVDLNDVASSISKENKKTYVLPDGSEVSLEQQSGPNNRYAQHVALPKTSIDDATYMYSVVHPSELENSVAASSETPKMRKILPGFPYSGSEDVSEDVAYTFPGANHGYGSELVPTYYEREYEHYKNPETSYKSEPATKFFGITGTTTRDIQLGLTFTVPFLNIPLTSLNSLLSGNGLSGMFNNVNFNSFLAVGAIAFSVIFVLPLMVYWFTGVNLSAFSWGRSDDGGGGGIPMANLVRSVEKALEEFDIDARTCLARTMCNQYQERSEAEDTPGRLGRGLLDTLAQHNYVKKYLGESRVKEALNHGSVGQCEKYYNKDACPWDSSAIVKILSRLVTSGNIDFASIATAAAKVAASNLASVN